jgi:hypothetical protein
VDADLGTAIPATPQPAQVIPPPSTPPVPGPAPSQVNQTARPAQAAAARPVQAAAARRRSRAAVIGAAVVLLSAAGWWARPQRDSAQDTATAIDAPARSRAVEPPPAAGASTPAPTPASSEKPPPNGTPPPAITADNEAARVAPPSAVVPDRKTAAGGSSGAAVTRVAEARLCGALSPGRGWRCEPLSAARPGSAVYFYTRVASRTDAVVKHRWTRNGSVVRVVDLRIRANAKEGFRTYSRQTGRALEAGQWQVALLDPSGAVLQEETFTIR